MSLPAYLPYGVVSIYGIGSNIAPSGISLSPGQLSGVIDQVSMYGVDFYSPGDNAIFFDKDVECRLTYTSGIYTLINSSKIICREVIPP